MTQVSIPTITLSHTFTPLDIQFLKVANVAPRKVEQAVLEGLSYSLMIEKVKDWQQEAEELTDEQRAAPLEPIIENLVHLGVIRDSNPRGTWGATTDAGRTILQRAKDGTLPGFEKKQEPKK